MKSTGNNSNNRLTIVMLLGIASGCCGFAILASKP